MKRQKLLIEFLCAVNNEAFDVFPSQKRLAESGDIFHSLNSFSTQRKRKKKFFFTPNFQSQHLTFLQYFYKITF